MTRSESISFSISLWQPIYHTFIYWILKVLTERVNSFLVNS